MALTLHKDEERRLATWKDVKSYAAEKDASVRWIDCARGTRVVGDEFIQVGGSGQFSVSMSGWASLCRKLGCDLQTIQEIHSPGLSTLVLNDYWARESDHMKSHRLVVDGDTVVGIVGSKYQPFRHGRLLDFINKIVLTHANRRNPEIVQGWKKIKKKVGIARVVGTELRVTLPLKKVVNSVGSGDEVVFENDESWVGIEARNGLTGSCAITFRAMIHRLVCSNGLIRLAGCYVNKVSHIGHENQLEDRVMRTLEKSNDSLSDTVEWLERLGSQVFRSTECVADSPSMKILEKILDNLDDSGIRWRNRLRRTHDKDRLARLVEEMAQQMAGSRSGVVWRSKYRKNRTWWDFVNIFTERAQHGRGLRRQLRVEELVGNLADRWVPSSQPVQPPR